MPHKIVELELTALPRSIAVPEDCGGIAILLRMNDHPVGFVMLACRPGSIFAGNRLNAILKHIAGKTELEARSEDSAARFLGASLTVAICTRNRIDDLTRCVASLEAIRAEFPVSFEILIIDNAPSDDSTRRLVATRPGVRYICEPKQGLDFARNRALHESRSDILAFIDDDAVVDRGWLRGLARAIEQHPDAEAFTGPILPFELQTEAQILFERKGGFNRRFRQIRHGASMKRNCLYPFRGIAGSGCNMTFRRDLLLKLNGFDEALDTGTPLPGGGDLDMFHRVIESGATIVHVPDMMIFHRHRRTYSEFRHQMYSWDLGFMTYVMKTFHTSPKQRTKALAVIAVWAVRKIAKLLVSVATFRLQALDLTLAEVRGGTAGIFGEYQRSLARSENIRRTYSGQPVAH